MDKKPKRTPSLEKACPFSSVQNWKHFGIFLLFSIFFFFYFSFLSFCGCWFVTCHDFPEKIVKDEILA
jgi:hypothetical protein